MKLIGDWLSKLAYALGTLGLTALLVLVTANIVSRTFFEVDLEMVEELTVWIMMWCIYIIAGLGLRTGSHITVDLLPERLKGRARHMFNVACFSLVLGFSVLFFKYCLDAVLVTKMLRLQAISSVAIPVWVIKLCLPIGMGLFAFFALEQILTNLAALRKGGESC